MHSQLHQQQTGVPAQYQEEHRHTQPLTVTSQALLISRAQGLTSTTISAKKKVGLLS